MARTIQFHLDENYSTALADGLRRFGIDDKTTADAGLRGALDPEHVAWALSKGRVIFTQDEDFLCLHGSGVAHAGIVYCHQQSLSLGRIIEGLRLVWEVYEPEYMRNRLEYL